MYDLLKQLVKVKNPLSQLFAIEISLVGDLLNDINVTLKCTNLYLIKSVVSIKEVLIKYEKKIFKTFI